MLRLYSNLHTRWKIIIISLLLSCLALLIYGDIYLSNNITCVTRPQNYTSIITTYVGNEYSGFNSDGTLKLYYVYSTDRQCMIYDAIQHEVGYKFEMYELSENWCYINNDFIYYPCGVLNHIELILCGLGTLVVLAIVLCLLLSMRSYYFTEIDTIYI